MLSLWFCGVTVAGKHLPWVLGAVLELVKMLGPSCLSSVGSRWGSEYRVLEPGRPVAAVCFPGQDAEGVVGWQAGTCLVSSNGQFLSILGRGL